MDVSRLIKFKDLYQNQYFYDYWDNRIYHINDCFNEVLKIFDKNNINDIISKLSNNFPKEVIMMNYGKLKKINETSNFIQEVKNKTINTPKEFLPNLDQETFQQSISNIRQLILEISQDCNFRCKYCVYSGTYSDQRNHGNNVMTFEIALKTIEYFFSLINSKQRTLKHDNIYFSFYGGEALCSFEMLKKIVDYIKNIETKEKIIFGITTNGSLLDDAKIDFLTENNFSIIFSLDGPESENDKYRVFKNNKGTYGKVFKNILKIKERDEKFFKRNVSFSVTYCKGHDILKINDFFSKNFKDNRLRVSSVRPDGTTFFEIIKPHEHFDRDFRLLNRKFLSSINDGKKLPHFTRELFCGPFLTLLNRDMASLEAALSETNRIFNISSTCFPGGEKLFVSADGVFYICERVNQYFSIGNYVKGIDFNKVKQIMNSYSRFILGKCLFCNAKRFCGLCISHHHKKNGFDFIGYCEDYKKKIPDILSSFVNLYLINKDSLIANLA